MSISGMLVSQSRACERSDLLVGYLHFLWRMKMARKDKVMVQLGGFFDLQRCQCQLKSVSGGFGVSYKAEEQARMWQPLSASESTGNGCDLASRRWDWGRIVHWQAWSYCRQVTGYAQYGVRMYGYCVFCTAARGLAGALISVARLRKGKVFENSHLRSHTPKAPLL